MSESESEFELDPESDFLPHGDEFVDPNSSSDDSGDGAPSLSER